MKLIEVEPTGTEKVTALIDWMGPDGKLEGGPCEIDSPIYPPSANGLLLYTHRMECQVTVRNGAEMLSFTPTELWGLEHGRYTLSDGDWNDLFKVVSKWEWKAEK